MTLKRLFFVIIVHYCSVSKNLKSFLFAFTFLSKTVSTIFSHIPQRVDLRNYRPWWWLSLALAFISRFLSCQHVTVLPGKAFAVCPHLCGVLTEHHWEQLILPFPFLTTLGFWVDALPGFLILSAILKQLELKAPFHIILWHTLLVCACTFMPY